MFNSTLYANTCLYRTPPGATHVAFLAPSPTAVNSFFTSALRAGGRIHGEPAIRDPQTGYYSAAVMDLDDNSVEVVHRPEHHLDDKTVYSTAASNRQADSRVHDWQKEVVKSTVSNSPTVERSIVRTIVNNITTTTLATPQPIVEHKPSDNTTSKTLIGTLIGAAAGAAIAYAMSKADQESTPQPLPQSTQAASYRAIEASSPGLRSATSPRSHYSASPSLHAPSVISPRSYHSSSIRRAIEAPGPAGSYSTMVDTIFAEGSRLLNQQAQSPRPSLARSNYTSPEMSHREARPTAPRSSTYSAARTVIQADYPPLDPAPRSRQPSTTSQQKWDHRSTVSRSRHSSYSAAPEPPPGPIVEEVDDDDAVGTVVPSDSISQAGSRKSKHRHRRRHSDRRETREDGKRSVVSLPVRELRGERENLGKRSVITQILGR